MSDPLNSKKIKIAIVAGEKSGDELGGPLMESLRTHFQDITFIGVGGEKMQVQGLLPLFPMDKISVMGIIEPLIKLKELLSLRKDLKNFFLKEKPDIFIGIDSPDFNLAIARFLRDKKSIKTVQYVGPSIWAWRSGRIKKIEKSVDKVLTLFPFEKIAYSNSSVEVSYVGHPLVHKLSALEAEKRTIRDQEDRKRLIALLPGSRRSEIKIMANLMIKAARILSAEDKKLKFFMPLLDESHKDLISEDYSGLIEFSYGNSQEILLKADLGMATSGTVTLEALLVRTPILAAYKTNWLSYTIIKPFLKVPFFSLPNLLANKEIIPELLQSEVTPENLVSSFKYLSKNKEKCLKEFEKIYQELASAGKEAPSKAILDLIKC
jgi:lipid-A-disaccharide synthase